MRHLRIVLRGISRVGTGPARHLGGLSLSSTSDRRATAGVSARRPTGAMELRRAAEVQKCADKGWKSALICLGNMRKGGVAPGSAAYNVALKACVEAGEFDRAAALAEDMEGSGATPDADILREIKAAGGGLGAGIEGDDDHLTCDSVASASGAPAVAPDGGGGGGGGGGRRSFSSLSGNRGGGRGVFAAGMHTVAVGADIDWPSRRPAHDCHGSSSSSSEDHSSGSLAPFDPFSLGPGTSTTSTSSMSSGGGSCSVSGMHTAVAVGADGAWPTRRPTGDSKSSGWGGGGGDRCRSLGHVGWGGGRGGWHKHHLRHDESGAVGSHAGGAVGKAEEGGAAALLSVTAAPFAGSWGDD